MENTSIDKLFTSKSQLRRAHKSISKIEDPAVLRKLCHIYVDRVYVADNLAENLSKLNEAIVAVVNEEFEHQQKEKERNQENAKNLLGMLAADITMKELRDRTKPCRKHCSKR